MCLFITTANGFGFMTAWVFEIQTVQRNETN